MIFPRRDTLAFLTFFDENYDRNEDLCVCKALSFAIIRFCFAHMCPMDHFSPAQRTFQLKSLKIIGILTSTLRYHDCPQTVRIIIMYVPGKATSLKQREDPYTSPESDAAHRLCDSVARLERARNYQR